MIDFGLYCDIKNSVKLQLSKDNSVTQWAMMLCDNNTGTDVFLSLIDNCDEEAVKKLMEYFEPAAPVQVLLRERLEVLQAGSIKYVDEKNIDEYKSVVKEKPSFYSYLTGIMEKKGFYTDAEFYNHISMSRQTFAKMRRDGATISRNHALLMAVGLGLNYPEAVEFMAKAGYVFKASDSREAIISYIMRHKKYDLQRMEEILYSMGEKTLMDI